MKNLFIIIGIFFVFGMHFSKAQTPTDIDNIVKKYPSSFLNTAVLAERIKKDFATEYAQSRAIYSWIALNIYYDTASFLHPKKPVVTTYKDEAERIKKKAALNDKIIAEVLLKKKAVCDGYARLFQKLAQELGLESQIINGMAKTNASQIGLQEVDSNHTWNAIKVDGKWRLVDVTWGAGSIINGNANFVKEFNTIYFDTPAKLFFAKHYPDNGLWQNKTIDQIAFLNAPLIFNEFIENNLEIIAPKVGVIPVVDNQKVTFIIKNILDIKEFGYSSNGRNIWQKIENPKQIGDSVQFDITFDKSMGKYLTFYLGQKSIVTYKFIFK
jgi:transglutaminase/protease-like cytokinesis protein 3